MKRIDGLDLWRGGLLAGLGVVRHTADQALPYGDPTWARTVIAVSDLFRMETFFAIAGLLAALSYRRKPSGWLSRRLGMLLTPSVVCGAIMLPLLPGFGWAHLWFLPALALCSFVPPKHVPLLALVAAAVLARALSRYLVLTGPEVLLPAFKAVYFVVFYVAGQQFALAPEDVGLSRPVAAAAATFVMLEILRPDIMYGGGAMAKAIVTAVHAVLSLEIARAVIAHAHRVDSVPRAARQLSAAAFTIYLVHFPLVVGLSRVLPPDTPFAALTVAAIAFLLSLVFHYAIVAQHRFAALLFNGCPLTGAIPS